VFARRGHQAAKLEEIAADAGLTTGAIYSNFAGKENLPGGHRGGRRRQCLTTTPAFIVRAAKERHRNSVERVLREDNTRVRSQLERSLGEQRLETATRRSMATISSVGDMSPKQTT
jgi:AcrR family transcriptional regulator